MSTILGLNKHHDGSACIVKDGKVISAISTERLTKIKKDYGATKDTIQYVLDAAGIKITDVDYVAESAYPFIKKSNDNYEKKDVEVSFDFGSNQIKKTLPSYLFPHHLCHCASSFYTSSFEESYSFSLDASNPDEFEHNSSIFYGNGNKLEFLSFIQDDRSIVGCLYNHVTKKLGLGEGLYKAGTTMGLACYGKSLDIRNIDFNIDEYCIDKDFKKSADYAATVQKLFELSVLSMLSEIKDRKTNNLCLSGGSMLNCTTNSKIVFESGFQNFHHFPACGDDGTAVGAALYLAHHILDEPRYIHKPHEICYLGKDDFIKKEIDYDSIVSLLLQNKIIGWFYGKSEFGPRALGHRSIISSPTNPHTRDILNHIVKNREWFRPFAPITTVEDYKDWFDFPFESPFMLYTAKVKKPHLIPAVSHVDQTARFQTVSEESNPEIHKLLLKFKEITNIPVLINTSLNGNGEPILETEDDAIKFLQNSNLDYMVINGRIFKKDSENQIYELL